MVACMKEQMTEKKKLEDVTEVQMKYQKEIEAIVRGMSSPKVMHDRLLDYHENDIAAALEDMNPTERQRLYRILNAEEISEVLSYIDEEEIPSYLEEMDMKKKAAVVSEMDADEIADLLRQMDKKERETLTELLDEEVRHKIDLIDSFDEEQIGNRMSTNYVEIPSNVTVKQAMRELIRQAADNDNISTLYIVDENRIFCGAISLNDLIIAREDTNLEDLIVVSYPFVYATEEIADCIEWIKDYSEDSIPVLDEENRIIGVITSQDIVEVVDDEMGEDYAMFAGLTAEEDLKEPLRESIKKRLPWLLVLLGLGMVVSSVVGIFETVVSQLTIIMAFQSLILDMAGNVGTQSLAVTIRVLMDESLTGKQKFQLVLKEMKIGFSNGMILGTISFALVGLYIALFKGKTFLFAYAVSGCIGLSLVLAMVVSGAVGTCIPLFFKKIHVDPAVASGPLITTINDLVAVVSYYGLSWILLINILHLAG